MDELVYKYSRTNQRWEVGTMGTESQIFVGIIVVCVIFIAISLIKHKPQMIVNAILRTFVGTTGIYLLDFILKGNGIQMQVGINAATILTNSFLGLPGFIMLYGLAAYYTYG